jgi:hypothetical protein
VLGYLLPAEVLRNVDKNNISILPLNPASQDLAFDLICHVFVKNSVLHRALQITTKEYRDYAAPWFELIVQQGFLLWR